MNKLIVFGTGKAAETLVRELNSDNIIIAYADNDFQKHNKYINGVKIINPKDIIEYDFDYIIIASQFEGTIYNQLIGMEINTEKIFRFIQYIDNYYDYVKVSLDVVRVRKEKIETLATGISYAQMGFASSYYNKEARNIANGSQDLFYDYNLAKYCIEKFKFENLKEVIIGLNYYSFEYDMSKSSMKDKVCLYYKNIGLYHNLNSISDKIKILNINDIIGKKIIKNIEKILITENNTYKKYVFDDEVGKIQANLDCKKNYPETVKENKIIFKEYLSFLKKNNIKPIVVVFPVTKYYSKHFSERIETEFHEIINEFKKKYDFQYIDYFRTDLFNDDDFRDVSHLNQQGAIKFTKILNEVIE